ncbi:Rhomboid domain-containing protein [Mycena sanguinolenta]|uniref:Rhomboid domain-containing protein n=1 Tax=Mycena sanguinolenta TaxID=230812 RepID=A0A8H6Z4W3_9AGAR|nr:Rhomboid domain-containing protein [Mycena sanguinolenta]
MFRLGLVKAPLTGSSSLRLQSSLPPCRFYFRTAFVAAKHKRSRLPVANNVKPPSRPFPRTQAPPIDPPIEPTPEPSEPPPTFDPAERDNRTATSARNQFLFAGSVIFSVFLWGAVRTNAETDTWVAKITHGRGAVGLDNGTLVRAKVFDLVEELKRWGNEVRQLTSSLPAIPQNAIRQAYFGVAEKYATANDATKVCWGICALNGAIFIAWHIPRLTGFMAANFVHRPLSGRAHTQLTSIFSHQSFFHLLFNSMALLSFGPIVGSYLYTSQPSARGTSNHLESTTGYHFLAMFIAAGLISSLASHTLRVRLYDRIVATLPKLSNPGRLSITNGSLGASGAIYACVTFDAVAYPDLTIAPIFIPWGVPIRMGVGALMMLDLVGLLRGWRMFDHIAHLGGAVFGLWYALYGPAIWVRWRAMASYLFDTKPKETKGVEEWK